MQNLDNLPLTEDEVLQQVINAIEDEVGIKPYPDSELDRVTELDSLGVTSVLCALQEQLQVCLSESSFAIFDQLKGGISPRVLANLFLKQINTSSQ